MCVALIVLLLIGVGALSGCFELEDCDENGKCRGGYVCGDDNKCHSCGDNDRLCCEGNKCDRDYECGTDGKCHGCGWEYDPCCEGDTCKEDGLRCSNGKCLECGVANNPCCEGNKCKEDNLVCQNGACVTVCKDSDGGSSPYAKGYTEEYINGQLVRNDDSCIENVLYEAVCREGWNRASDPINCGDEGKVCQNGACV